MTATTAKSQLDNSTESHLLPAPAAQPATLANESDGDKQTTETATIVPDDGAATVQLVARALLRLLFQFALLAGRLLFALGIKLLVRLLETAKVRRVKPPAEATTAGEILRQFKSNRAEGRPKTASHTTSGRGRLAARTQRVVLVQMSRQVVAGFEEQQVANDLSAQVVEEALQSAVQQLKMQQEAAAPFEAPASGEDSARIQQQQDAREPARQAEATNSDAKTEQPVAAVRALSHDRDAEPNASDQLRGDTPHSNETEQDVEVNISLDSMSSSSSPSPPPSPTPSSQLSLSRAAQHGEHGEEDEYCGQQASEINLRQLRLSALEDVLVCGQQRQATESARRLFEQLATSPTVEPNKRPAIEVSKARGSSLSSHSSNCDDEDANSSTTQQHNRADIDYLDELLGGVYSSSSNRDDLHCGTIKLERRCCSSSSSSSGNFGRTLVCSVSPTSPKINGLMTNSLDRRRVASTGSKLAPRRHCDVNDNLDTSTRPMDKKDSNGGDLENDLSYYPIDGDEIRQCRAAFRENRRLIEQAQAEAFKRLHEQQSAASNGCGLSRSASQAAMQQNSPGCLASVDRSRWADSLGRRSRLPNCARCQQQLYPVDKMDLDFTRATLNIHRNCFKCQVCATLLRLETYASIDAKLYCPAHVKCATPSR